jgi:GxxExxY protein
VASDATGVIQNAPWLEDTYRIIGLAMEVHNEIGPGNREAVYHNAMAAKCVGAGLDSEDEPFVPVTLGDDTVVGGNSPDLVVKDSVSIELKARSHLMTKDDQAQIIGYFAALPQCAVALFINVGRQRLEYPRVLPPKSVQKFQRQKWGKEQRTGSR